MVPAALGMNQAAAAAATTGTHSDVQCMAFDEDVAPEFIDGLLAEYIAEIEPLLLPKRGKFVGKYKGYMLLLLVLLPVLPPPPPPPRPPPPLLFQQVPARRIAHRISLSSTQPQQHAWWRADCGFTGLCAGWPSGCGPPARPWAVGWQSGCR